MYVNPTYDNWPLGYQLIEWCQRDLSGDGKALPLDYSLLNNPTDIIFPRYYDDTTYNHRQGAGMSAADYVYIVGVVDNEKSQPTVVPIQQYSIAQDVDIIINHHKLDSNNPCNVQCEVARTCPNYTVTDSLLRQSKVESIGNLSGWINKFWRFGTITAVLEGCDQPCTVDMYHGSSKACFAGSTHILLADNTFKPARRLTANDIVMCWNFDEGKMEASDLLWFTHDHITNSYDKIITDTGRTFKNVGNHRLFSLTTNKFERSLEMIGHQVWTLDGVETIIDIETVNESVDFCNAISSKNMNIITEGFLSSCGFNNLYPIKDMRYIKDYRQHRPIAVYGDIPQSWYHTLRLGEHYCDPTDVKPYIDNSILLVM